MSVKKTRALSFPSVCQQRNRRGVHREVLPSKVMPQSGYGYTQNTGLGSVTVDMLKNAGVFLFAGHGYTYGLENGLTSDSFQEHVCLPR